MKIYTLYNEYPTFSYYNSNAFEYFCTSVKADMSNLYRPFLKLVPHDGVILDAGCGSGRDTKYFLSLGYQVIAIDASIEMVKLSTEYTKHQTHFMNFYDLNFRNKFDGIWAVSSLIHIPKQDIDCIIKSLANALKANGVLCVSFKEGLGEKIENGRFFNYYTQEAFSSLISNHSRLKIERLWDSKDAIGREQNWITALVRKVKK